MPKSTVLDRVAADLAQGRTAPAIQRLSSLVHAHPADLDLRRQLAAVHRRAGDPVEAGRWGYLLADAPAAELAAFERAYPQPGPRWRRLGWHAPIASAPTGYARDQLTALSAQAQARAVAPAWGSVADGGQGRALPPAARIALVAAFAVLLALVAVGAVTVAQWLLG
jgi:hypothetical protein